ncbi:MAG: hypothetical protein O7G88_01175, partial [bacterium]|nr:hypothetical protein [bacterium]
VVAALNTASESGSALVIAPIVNLVVNVGKRWWGGGLALKGQVVAAGVVRLFLLDRADRRCRGMGPPSLRLVRSLGGRFAILSEMRVESHPERYFGFDVRRAVSAEHFLPVGIESDGGVGEFAFFAVDQAAMVRLVDVAWVAGQAAISQRTGLSVADQVKLWYVGHGDQGLMGL